LTLDVSHGGGCEQRYTGLCFGGFLERAIVYSGLRFEHEFVGDDICAGEYERTLKYDLRPLRTAYLEAYGSDRGLMETNFGHYGFGDLECQQRVQLSNAQISSAIARGEGTGGALMQASHAMDPRYPVTDGYLLQVLKALGAAGFIDGAPTGPLSEATFKGVNVTVTALGRQALAGAIDRVHERGIDTWRGGVHLEGRGPVWRWHSSERRLIEK
jgi:hypothetical protein